MLTPMERLAQQAITLSETIVGDLMAQGQKGAPLQYVLFRAKQCSTRALSELVMASPADPEMIRSLQNEAELYSRMVEFVRGAVESGLEADGTSFKPVPIDDASEIYQDVLGGFESEGDLEQ